MISTVSAAGPGLWIRLRAEFTPRLSEWMLGITMLLWGTAAIFEYGLFAQPEYIGFRLIFGDSLLLGLVMTALGIARLVGLLINGVRERVTPWVRVSSAGVGFLIWIGMICAYAMSPLPGVWVAIYPVFASVEVVNVYRGARDAGRYRRAREAGGRDGLS